MSVRGAILFGLAALGASAAGHAQMRPSKSADIVQAAETCMIAVSGAGVDKAALTARGWAAATASSDGKPVAMTVPIYGKGSMLIMLTSDGSPACFVTARVRKVADAQVVRDGLARLVGTAPFGTMDGGPMWLMPDGKAIQFATTGTQEKPAVRIAVVRSSGDKK